MNGEAGIGGRICLACRPLSVFVSPWLGALVAVIGAAPPFRPLSWDRNPPWPLSLQSVIWRNVNW